MEKFIYSNGSKYFSITVRILCATWCNVQD